MMHCSRIWGAAALAAAPFLLPGCGSLLRQPANVEATREDVAALRREQTELTALVLELRTRLESQSEATASLRADTNLELRQIAERLDVLTARLEDLGPRSERSAPRPAPAASDTARAGGNPGPGGPGAIFDAAKRDYSRGNYQLARSGFEEVLAADPRGQLADDAQYWAGESSYGLGEIDRAIQEFLRVRDVFPEGDQVAAATLKIGIAFLRKEDPATARRYFETVVREFPGSPEAALAQDRLKTLR